MNANRGLITGLFRKIESGMPMSAPLARLDLIGGKGILNDRNANSFSPRQVLIVRQEDLEEFAISPGQLRENIVLSGLSAKTFEPGTLLKMGESELRLTFHCEPCKRIAPVVPSLKEILGRRGILAVVLKGGAVDLGTAVEAVTDVFEPFPAEPYGRFLRFIADIPIGKIVTYRQVTLGMGVATSYTRAVPQYIKKASDTMYPVHRILDSQGNLIPDYVPDQTRMLIAEGIDVDESIDLFGNRGNYSVDLSRFGWIDESYFLK